MVEAFALRWFWTGGYLEGTSQLGRIAFVAILVLQDIERAREETESEGLPISK